MASFASNHKSISKNLLSFINYGIPLPVVGPIPTTKQCSSTHSTYVRIRGWLMTILLIMKPYFWVMDCRFGAPGLHPGRSFWFVGGGRRLNINDDDDAALIRVHLPMHRYSLGWTIARNEVLRGCDFDIRSNPHRSD